jgi:hypothetical protein
VGVGARTLFPGTRKGRENLTSSDVIVCMFF